MKIQQTPLAMSPRKRKSTDRAHTTTGIVWWLTLLAFNVAAGAEDAPANPRNQHMMTTEGIFNYYEYSERFASSGQPTKEQLVELKDKGFQRVVYIAFSDQKRALPAQDRIVKELGLDYVHIPVDWTTPLEREYDAFARAMAVSPERKTLLHCQANFRASVFSMLYRVIERGVPLQQAVADMQRVWIPNTVWTKFARRVLQNNDVNPDCEGCDWTPSTIGE